MPPANQNVMPQEAAKDTLSRLLLAFKYLESTVPDLTLDSFKAFLVIALASWDKGSLRLPDVTKVSKVLDKSLSRGSRVVGTLSDPEGLALVESRSGLSGTRAESLVLTERGKDLISTFLEVLTKQHIDEIQVQSFEGLQDARNAAKEQKTDQHIYLKQTHYDKSTLTIIVGPKSDVMSEMIQKWCRDNLSEMPTMAPRGDQVSVSFATVSDAVYFKLRWCW
jgi:hypothetical protein